jgi:class 3 adenylate cyclase
VAAPPVRYARRDGVHIAYLVIGGGPPDVVFSPDWISNIELYWEEPHLARVFRRLASFVRLIMFDMRGTGASDPIEQGVLTAEEWMADVETVLDAVGSERASVIGMGHAGQVAMLHAASRPDRIASLALYNSYARLSMAPDYPAGMAPEVQAQFLSTLEALWGTGRLAKVLGPSIADEPGLVEYWGKVERLSMPPSTAMARARLIFSLDVRAVLPTIRVPTLVLHTRENPIFSPAHAGVLVSGIPGARYVDLPGADHWPLGDELLDRLAEFLTGERPPSSLDRLLSTVLITDIVNSTKLASTLGDVRWRRLIERHDRVARQVISEFRGRYVKSTGDGLLATFDGPARGIECAKALRNEIANLDLRIRAGLHTGEIELLGDDIAGIAVNVAARVSALAAANEILVSRVVRDLVAGSDIAFTEHGTHRLRGVPERWTLYAAD